MFKYLVLLLVSEVFLWDALEAALPPNFPSVFPSYPPHTPLIPPAHLAPKCLHTASSQAGPASYLTIAN